jgi:hypothetical protein
MKEKETEKFPFSFFDRPAKNTEAFFFANKRADAEGTIT